jgi:hypothetical protein
MLQYKYFVQLPFSPLLGDVVQRTGEGEIYGPNHFFLEILASSAYRNNNIKN